MTSTTTEAPARVRIRALEPEFAELTEFLVDEADLLDADQYLEWLELTTDDIAYEMPGRETVYVKDGDGFDDANSVAYARDNKASLTIRARHNVEAPSASFRQPPDRAHRLVTNVVVHRGDSDDEYQVKSSLLMLVNRFDQSTPDMITAKRFDVIRRTPDGLRLAKRTILVDQTLLAQPFGNLFL